MHFWKPSIRGTRISEQEYVKLFTVKRLWQIFNLHRVIVIEILRKRYVQLRLILGTSSVIASVLYTKFLGDLSCDISALYYKTYDRTGMLNNFVPKEIGITWAIFHPSSYRVRHLVCLKGTSKKDAVM